jgi:hypothetical protein
MPDRPESGDSLEREDLDLQLDRALATYADPEANPHLAAHILAAIAPGRPAVPRRRWRPWAIALAIPALAALLLAMFLPLRRAHEPHPKSTTAAAPHIPGPITPGPMAPPHTVANSQPPQTAAKARRAPIQPPAVDASLPKQEIFPTPTPLTPQEQALADLANRNPGSVSQSVSKAEKQPVEPLEIAAIQIQPLNPPGKGQN